MRSGTVSMTLAALALAGSAGPAAAAAPPERLAIANGFDQELRGGHVFVPVRSIALPIGARVRWDTATRRAGIVGRERSLWFRAGDPVAEVDGRPERLAAVPYLKEGETWVPLRFVARSFEVPVRYDPRAESVLVGPVGRDLLFFPLASPRTGVVIHSPRPNAAVGSNIQVVGQSRHPGGQLVIRLEGLEGQVVGEIAVPASDTNHFLPFQAFLGRSPLPEGVGPHLRLVAYTRLPGDRTPRGAVTIPVRVE